MNLGKTLKGAAPALSCYCSSLHLRRAALYPAELRARSVFDRGRDASRQKASAGCLQQFGDPKERTTQPLGGAEVRTNTRTEHGTNW